MKHTFLSNREFLSKCPCGYNIASYVKTLIPTQAMQDFQMAQKTDENAYEATYDVFSPDRNHIGQITVSCTEAPGADPEYKVIDKSGSL